MSLEKLTKSIRTRHAGDPTRLPSADNLLALLGYVSRHVDDLKEGEDRREERVHALYLSRLIELELLRYKLRLYQSGLADGMTARQLGKPEGLNSRTAIKGRIGAFKERLAAAKVYMNLTEYRQWRMNGSLPIANPDTLLAIAGRLISHVADDARSSHVAVDEEVLDSAEGIALTLKESGAHQAGSVLSQLRDIVEEIDHAADEQEVPPARGPAVDDLQAARDWLRSGSASRRCDGR